MIIDVHCHLFLEQFDSDRKETIERARLAGVGSIINVGIDPESNQKALDLAREHTEFYATAGWHPHSADRYAAEHRELIIQSAKSSDRVVAVGEIGLDYFKSTSPRQKQKNVFLAMLGIAKELNLPAIIHSRDAFEDTVSVIRESQIDLSRVVYHCFSYGTEELQTALTMGSYISFTANVTYPGAQTLRDVLKKVPSDRYMIETDAPYLAPQGKRGQRNEPAFLPLLAEAAAKERGVSVDQVITETSSNSRKFFGL